VAGVRGAWIHIDAVLEALVNAYEEWQNLERRIICDAYEEVLFEMSRGMPPDGRKGRPLGAALPLDMLKAFAVDAYPGLTEEILISMLLPLLPDGIPEAPGGEYAVDSDDEDKDLCAQTIWGTLDILLALDDIIGLSNYFAQWGRSLANTSARVVVAGGKDEVQTALMVQHRVDLSVASGPGDSIKSAMTRMAFRDRRSRPTSAVSHMALSSRPTSAALSRSGFTSSASSRPASALSQGLLSRSSRPGSAVSMGGSAARPKSGLRGAAGAEKLKSPASVSSAGRTPKRPQTAMARRSPAIPGIPEKQKGARPKSAMGVIATEGPRSRL